MSSYDKTVRARLGLEKLEAREVPAALPVPSPMPLIGKMQMLESAPMQINAMPAAKDAVTAGAFRTADPRSIAPVRSVFYSAVTLRNTSTVNVAYSFTWPGAGTSNYTLKPGESRVHYIKQANVTAQIRFDKSTQSGYQEQKHSLPSLNYFGTSFRVPQVGNGKLYVFQNTTPSAFGVSDVKLVRV